MSPSSVGSPLLWAGFIAFVLVMLVLDLGVFHKDAHEVKTKEALKWTIVWIVLSLLFNLGVYLKFGQTAALQFLTGYIIEKALSVDNIFVFVIIFSSFAVPAKLQHRVLFWGILGALILRALFVGLGTALLVQFRWILYVFGAFLVFTGIKLFASSDMEVEPEKNPVFRLFRRFVPALNEYRGTAFIVREPVTTGEPPAEGSEEGSYRSAPRGPIKYRYYATPLLVVLVAIEATDLVFAVDSIPAIFAITTDPFLVYSSNICAVLGLRAMYFLLAEAVQKLHYLKVGLAAVLTFIGAKMLISFKYHLDVRISLLIVVALIGGSVVFSLIKTKKEPASHTGT